MRFEPVSFRHPLMDNLPPALPKEILGELVNRLIVGDEEARQILITDLLLISKRCIGTIIAVYPQNIKELDDMVSEAALVVVLLVDRLSKGLQIDPVKLRNYTGVTVLQQVNEMLVTNSAIRIPPASFRRHYRQGKESPVKFSDNEFDGEAIPDPASETDFDVREALEAIISTPIERRILELREAGHSDIEIGELINLSQQTVSLLRANLYQRYIDAIT